MIGWPPCGQDSARASATRARPSFEKRPLTEPGFARPFSISRARGLSYLVRNLRAMTGPPFTFGEGVSLTHRTNYTRIHRRLEPFVQPFLVKESLPPPY